MEVSLDGWVISAAADIDWVPWGSVGNAEAPCGRLDKLPLAIEMAAAWSRSLTARELVARLDDQRRLLRHAGKPGSRRTTARIGQNVAREEAHRAPRSATASTASN